MITRAPGQGYWNYVVAIMTLVFVVYVTVSGDLPKWFALFSFKPAAAPTASGGAPASSSAPNALAPSSTAPTFGNFFQQGVLPHFTGILSGNIGTFKAIGGLLGIGGGS